jgi:hypothetical protein
MLNRAVFWVIFLSKAMLKNLLKKNIFLIKKGRKIKEENLGLYPLYFYIIILFCLLPFLRPFPRPSKCPIKNKNGKNASI